MRWEDMAVLRQCRHCGDWRSLSAYKPNALICDQCMRGARPQLGGAINRGYALTQKARDYLAAERAVA